MAEEHTRLEIKALDILNDYIRDVYNRLIKKLALMVESLIKGDQNEIEKGLENVLRVETESIDIKNEVLDIISEAEGMIHRGDLMRLVLLVAQLADSSTGLGYRIQAASLWKPDDDSIKKMQAMMDNVKESIKLVREAIFLLPQNAGKSMDVAKEIESYERLIDGLQRDFIQHIYDLDLDFNTILRIRDFIIRLEEISDIAADIGEAIRVLAVSRYGVPR
ncbi:MAG: DUF47 family protein [Candidatus Lokiarchaeota archaeon]|nr:DUF47 family protein [Candidatus Lokiarchaeota archaeon]